MSRISTIKTAARTLAVALGIGLVMQIGAGNSTGGESTSTDLSAVRTLMTATNAQGEAVFGVPDVVTTPLDHTKTTQPVWDVDAVYPELADPQMGTILATPIEGCGVSMSAEPVEAAMVSLSLSAPCALREDFVLRHEAFQMSARTDEDGTATLLAPALTEDATFVVLFDNVEHARVTVGVPDVRLFDRAVLQWQDVFNLQLHALESGASIGEPDHVWSASIHTPQSAIAGEGGFVMRFGTTNTDMPYLAEVYTYPQGHDDQADPTILQVGVAVTEANCGREVDTILIRASMGRSLVTKKMAAALPGCDAIGEVAMLRDKFEDLTLAAR